jgi:hypothetical protein
LAEHVYHLREHAEKMIELTACKVALVNEQNAVAGLYRQLAKLDAEIRELKKQQPAAAAVPMMQQLQERVEQLQLKDAALADRVQALEQAPAGPVGGVGGVPVGGVAADEEEEGLAAAVLGPCKREVFGRVAGSSGGTWTHLATMPP